MAPKRALTPSTTQPVSNIWLSKKSSFSDSTFIAAFSSVLSYNELKKLPIFSDADHRIGAWRMPSKQKTLTASTTFVTGHEDDGERGGGQCLINLLVKLKIDGCVVVARWFGGTMIGPKRWTMIEDAAREAIQKWSRFYNVPTTPDAKRPRLGTSNTPASTSTQQSITTSPTTAALASKPYDPVAEHKNLVESLKQRDENIPVLRILLTDTRAKLRSFEAAPARTMAAISPARSLNYSTMPLAQLQRLSAARDATVDLLLNQIAEAEEQQKKEEAELDEAFIEAADRIESEETSAVSKTIVSTNPSFGTEDDPEYFRRSSSASESQAADESEIVT